MSEKLRRVKDRINNYRASVFASVFLRQLIEEKWDLDYTVYYGGNIDEEKEDSPDFVIKSENKKDILGDLKKSLSRRELSEDTTLATLREEYGEEEVLNSICGDLEHDADKYSSSFTHITDPHDLFFFYRSKYNAVPRIWNELSEIPQANHVAGISYEITQGRSKALAIDLDFGEFSDGELNERLRLGDTEYPYEEIPDIVLEDEILVVEENDSPPIGYLIFVLWTVVFEELEQKPKEELILDRFEREQSGEITEMKFEVDELLKFLNDSYHVPFYDPDPRGGTRHQFSDDKIRNALDIMSKVDGIALKKVDPNEGVYRVEYGVISKGSRDALETIIERMEESGVGEFESEEEEVEVEETQSELSDF